MSHRTRLIVAAPAVAIALALALTGCGKLDAHPAGGVDDSSGAGSASTPAATEAASDSATLDGISQDLDSASNANTEAGSNAQAGDQAAASSDEP
ncbi:MAG TPA: hypothetical protein VGM38_09920 [Pseudolysinimonas sp.]